MKDGRSLPKKAFVLWEAVAFIATGVLEGLLAVLLHRWFFLRLWTLWLLGLVAVIFSVLVSAPAVPEHGIQIGVPLLLAV